MDTSNLKNTERKRKRALRVRKHVRGTNQCPRMCVVKTNKHIQVQLVDDEAGKTMAACATNSSEFKNTPYTKRNKESAKKLGEVIAEKAKKLGINEVVFDRGPFRYHGILAELANSARAGGLQF